jgi:hypothetical protein
MQLSLPFLQFTQTCANFLHPAPTTSQVNCSCSSDFANEPDEEVRRADRSIPGFVQRLALIVLLNPQLVQDGEGDVFAHYEE